LGLPYSDDDIDAAGALEATLMARKSLLADTQAESVIAAAPRARSLALVLAA
jgi:hypothetical protein